MRCKYRERFTSKARQAGFTLIELLIAMLISLTLVFACTTLYSSLKSSIMLAQNLATAQESLRGAFYLMSRSVRQAQSFTISGAVLTTTYGAAPADSNIYSCLGNSVSGSTDTYSSDGDGLYCDDGSGAQLIALDVTELQFEEISAASGTSDDGLKVTMKIDGLPSSYDDGITFTLALRQRYYQSYKAHYSL